MNECEMTMQDSASEQTNRKKIKTVPKNRFPAPAETNNPKHSHTHTRVGPLTSFFSRFFFCSHNLDKRIDEVAPINSFLCSLLSLSLLPFTTPRKVSNIQAWFV